MSEIINAEIKSTMLGMEGHGIFTVWLNLDFGGSGQGFGGYCLDEPKKVDGEHIGRFGTAYGMQKIMDLLSCLEVESWEKLPKTHIRVEREDRWNGKILRIGHLLKDRWFTFEAGA